MNHWCRDCGQPAHFCMWGAWWCDRHIRRFERERLAAVATLLRRKGFTSHRLLPSVGVAA